MTERGDRAVGQPGEVKAVEQLWWPVVFFTDTPQQFGHEIRGIAVVDILNGKFVRWVDYWDGHHFGVSATESLRTPPAQFPADFGESRVGESAAPAMTRIAGELSTDFARDNSEQAAQLFAPDAVLEDLTLHTAIVGRQSIAAWCTPTTSSWGRCF